MLFSLRSVADIYCFPFLYLHVYMTSCTPQKHLITIEEQKAKVEAANNLIATLEKEKADLLTTSKSSEVGEAFSGNLIIP